MILEVDSGRPIDTSARVLVVGAGPGGWAMATYFSTQGHSVFLWEPFEHVSLPLNDLTYSGVLGSGSLSLNGREDLPADLAASCQVIVITTLPSALDVLNNHLTPSLTVDQLVLSACGGLVSLGLHRRRANSEARSPLWVELSCFPFSARLRDTSHLSIRSERPALASTLPRERADEALSLVPGSWISATAHNVVHCALSNPNYVLHPSAVVLNAASWDRSEKVEREGLTDGAEKLAQVLDAERRAVLRALGLPDTSLAELMRPLSQGRRASEEPIGPERILDRFIIEDVGWGLSIVKYLGQAMAVETPICDAILNLCATTFGDKMMAFRPDLLGWPEQPSGLSRAFPDILGVAV